MTLENVLSDWGLPGLFLGAMAEGEGVAIFGGVLAHRHIVSFEGAALVVAAGAFAIDQLIFRLGRHAGRFVTVRRALSRSEAQRLLARIVARPVLFCLGFRFVYGMKTLGALAIGSAGVPALRFALLDIAGGHGLGASLRGDRLWRRPCDRKGIRARRAPPSSRAGAGDHHRGHRRGGNCPESAETSMTRPRHPTALVTGANRGIGRAIAAGLLAKGCRVTIGARDPRAGAEAAEALGCDWTLLDLEDPDSYFAAMTRAGGFDILVNNAGVLRDVSLLDRDSDFDIAMQVMVSGPLDLIRSNVHHWRDTGWGRIVNLSSGWGSFAAGLGGPGAYGVAKAALNALTKALPRDLPPGVKVNAMCPGWVATRMGGAGAPRGPEEAAATAIWLALLPDEGPTGGFFRDRQPIDW